MWQNSKCNKPQNVTKFLKKSLNGNEFKNPKYDKTQKLKMWRDLKSQNLTKFKIYKYDKTQKIQKNYKKITKKK